MERAIFFFDGGCRPNPGPMEAAVVHRGLTRFCDELGSGDNNEAEWLALLFAVELALEQQAGDVVFIGDSALVVAQASGRWPCRSAHLQTYLARFRELVSQFTRHRLRQVPRSKNLAGIALAQRHILI